MADPIGYVLQNIVNPKFDVIMLWVANIGLILIILWMITDFINNKKLQTILFNIHDKIKNFIENKNINAV